MTRNRLITMIAVSAVVFCALLTSVVYAWGVYRSHWEGPLVTRVADTLPIPAARVGNRTVLLRDYFDSLRSVETYLASPEAVSQQLQRPMNNEDRKSALERLIQESALSELAASRSVTVTEEQEQAVLAELDVTATSTESFQEFIQTNYGWSMDDFKTHIVRPLVLTRVLGASFAADHSGDVNALSTYLTERVARPDVVRYVAF